MRAPDRGRPTGRGDRPPGQRGGQRPPQRDRVPYREQTPRVPAQPTPFAQTGGSEPWSEVPAEVQELLRAELARRSGGRPSGGAAHDQRPPVADRPEGVTSVTEPAPKAPRGTRSRTSRGGTAATAGSGNGVAPSETGARQLLRSAPPARGGRP